MLSSTEHFLDKKSRLIFHCILPLTFFGVTFWLMPLTEVFQFDPDEGQEMIKALLYAQGFPLYTKIWSDQPPFFTLILYQWLNIWGNSILAGRLLILCFATFLIWIFSQLIRMTVGNLYAILGCFLLAISCNFARLSVSVMIGLPALTLVMFSIYFIFLYGHKNQKIGWLIFAGISFALSLQIKMFTIFLLPLLLFYVIIFSSQSHNKKTKILDLIELKKLNSNSKIATETIQNNQSHSSQNIFIYFSRIFNQSIPPLLFLIPLGLTFYGMLFLIPDFTLQQAFQNHIDTDFKQVFVRENSLWDVFVMYLQEFDYTLLAAAILPTLLSWKKITLKQFPLLWLILATFMMMNHKPIWYHHYLLISIPLTWLAVLGVQKAVTVWQQYQPFQRIKQQQWQQVIPKNGWIYLLLFSLFVTPIKIGATQLNNHYLLQQSKLDQEVLQTLMNTNPNTQWLFTDIPMYAVYAHWNIPPEIATLSRKRVAAGEFTQDYLDSLIQNYQPEQVLIQRFPEVSSYFQGNPIIPYQPMNQDHPGKHYIKKDSNNL